MGINHQKDANISVTGYGLKHARVNSSSCCASDVGMPQLMHGMGIAAQWNLLSIEQTIEELYGDTKDEKWKSLEVERIKELRGIVTMDQPAPGGPLPAAKPAVGGSVNGSNDEGA